MVDSTRQQQLSLLNNDVERMRDWLRESGKLLLEERRRTAQQASQLEQQARQLRQQLTRLWLLEQAVATLKAELRQLAANYEACENQLATTLSATNETTERKP